MIVWTSFVGFMASGKSTVAHLLGQGTGQSVVDLDAEVARRAGCSVPEIFRREGVGGFRTREQEALRALPAGGEILLATGAGSVEVESSGRLLRQRGVVIWLDAPWEVIRVRLERGGSERWPAIDHLGWQGLRLLQQRRQRLYALIADFRLRSDRADAGRVARDALLRGLIWRRRGRRAAS
jgi:shikimate kinase